MYALLAYCHGLTSHIPLGCSMSHLCMDMLFTATFCWVATCPICVWSWSYQPHSVGLLHAPSVYGHGITSHIMLGCSMPHLCMVMVLPATLHWVAPCPICVWSWYYQQHSVGLLHAPSVYGHGITSNIPLDCSMPHLCMVMVLPATFHWVAPCPICVWSWYYQPHFVGLLHAPSVYCHALYSHILLGCSMPHLCMVMVLPATLHWVAPCPICVWSWYYQQHSVGLLHAPSVYGHGITSNIPLDCSMPHLCMVMVLPATFCWVAPCPICVLPCSLQPHFVGLLHAPSVYCHALYQQHSVGLLHAPSVYGHGITSIILLGCSMPHLCMVMVLPATFHWIAPFPICVWSWYYQQHSIGLLHAPSVYGHGITSIILLGCSMPHLCMVMVLPATFHWIAPCPICVWSWYYQHHSVGLLHAPSVYGHGITSNIPLDCSIPHLCMVMVLPATFHWIAPFPICVWSWYYQQHSIGLLHAPSVYGHGITSHIPLGCSMPHLCMVMVLPATFHWVAPCPICVWSWYYQQHSIGLLHSPSVYGHGITSNILLGCSMPHLCMVMVLPATFHWIAPFPICVWSWYYQQHSVGLLHAPSVYGHGITSNIPLDCSIPHLCMVMVLPATFCWVAPCPICVWSWYYQQHSIGLLHSPSVYGHGITSHILLGCSMPHLCMVMVLPATFHWIAPFPICVWSWYYQPHSIGLLHAPSVYGHGITSNIPLDCSIPHLCMVMVLPATFCWVAPCPICVWSWYYQQHSIGLLHSPSVYGHGITSHILLGCSMPHLCMVMVLPATFCWVAPCPICVWSWYYQPHSVGLLHAPSVYGHGITSNILLGCSMPHLCMVMVLPATFCWVAPFPICVLSWYYQPHSVGLLHAPSVYCHALYSHIPLGCSMPHLCMVMVLPATFCWVAPCPICVWSWYYQPHSVGLLHAPSVYCHALYSHIPLGCSMPHLCMVMVLPVTLHWVAPCPICVWSWSYQPHSVGLLHAPSVYGHGLTSHIPLGCSMPHLCIVMVLPATFHWVAPCPICVWSWSYQQHSIGLLHAPSVYCHALYSHILLGCSMPHLCIAMLLPATFCLVDL